MEKTEEQLKREKWNKITNERLKNTEWYCDVCGNGKKLHLQRKIYASKDKET